ncbi:hypothetical protein FHC51_11095 [Leclercia sp. EC_58]|uniref:hypothetical protein n=1 Tax=Leclercia sp. EC_58 TaxID=2584090 RepID=UPI001C70ACC5|nr:hypothetical protein [Leclercia sp. EC_58]MBW9400354.1 hypothetical protein [Leclercia sp. EC_58]
MNSHLTGLKSGQLPIFNSLDVSVEVMSEVHPLLDMPSSYLLTCSAEEGWKLIDRESSEVITSEKETFIDGKKLPFRIWFGDTLVFESDNNI